MLSVVTRLYLVICAAMSGTLSKSRISGVDRSIALCLTLIFYIANSVMDHVLAARVRSRKDALVQNFRF